MNRVYLTGALLSCVVCVAALVVGAPRVSGSHPKVGKAMGDAARSFLSSLDAERKARASFAFTDDERLNWHFVPRERKGLPFKAMTESQREKATVLLKTGMGASGYQRVTTIMSLETVLKAMENGNPGRDSENYFFSVFGTPTETGAWGWRFEGHHLALNVTVMDGKMVATAPVFFGANPADVRTGPMAGTRALAAEEDLGRALIESLTAEQRKEAVFLPDAPSDILTLAAKKVDPLAPAGISVAKLSGAQRKTFDALLKAHASTAPDPLAKERLARAKDAGWTNVRFGWAGGLKKGEKHYYRIQGPTFLVEYDNTQNDGNHIHSVWRDFAGDFGRDFLAEHLTEDHGG